MISNTPKRRGRPPANAEQSNMPTESGAQAAGTSKRRRRSSVGGHALKLSAPTREGYTRRWFNDDGNRIADAQELGYEHVTDTAIKSSGPGSSVSRLVGSKANGEPLHAFLMETPNELYAEGVDEKEAYNRLVDQAISDGRDLEGNTGLTKASTSMSSIRR